MAKNIARVRELTLELVEQVERMFGPEYIQYVSRVVNNRLTALTHEVLDGRDEKQA